MGLLSRLRRRRGRLEGLSDRLWTGGGRLNWRLDVPEDSNDRGMFLPPNWRGRRRLMHYISAGGMRQLRGRRVPAESWRRHRLIVRFFILYVAIWIVFRYVQVS